jgi:hypothetical protein
VVGYEPSTATRKTYTNSNLNEPRIDRAGREHHLVGARLDEDDRDGGADQPHQRPLQGEHAGRRNGR